MKLRKYPLKVCKPCWELHYCPYGPLVEDSPVPPQDGNITSARVSEMKRRHSDLIKRVKRIDPRDGDSAFHLSHALLYSDPEQWQGFVGYDIRPLSCNVYGHICPVFVNARKFTETVRERSFGRHIPRGVMLKVVRRDGNTCQKCSANVPDNDLHFDHVIPISKGGPTTAENLRVVCSKCNLEKGDDVGDLLWRDRGVLWKRFERMRNAGTFRV